MLIIFYYKNSFTLWNVWSWAKEFLPIKFPLSLSRTHVVRYPSPLFSLKLAVNQFLVFSIENVERERHDRDKIVFEGVVWYIERTSKRGKRKSDYHKNELSQKSNKLRNLSINTTFLILLRVFNLSFDKILPVVLKCVLPSIFNNHHFLLIRDLINNLSMYSWIPKYSFCTK